MSTMPVCITYRGYTLHQFGGLWHVYSNLVEVTPDSRSDSPVNPIWLDRYIQLDLAKRFVRIHREQGDQP